MNSDKTITVMGQIEKFAAADLRVALKDGYMVIGHTKKGTLQLSYEKGVYTLSTFGLMSTVLAQGKPAVVRPALANLYSCVRE